MSPALALGQSVHEVLESLSVLPKAHHVPYMQTVARGVKALIETQFLPGAKCFVKGFLCGVYFIHAAGYEFFDFVHKCYNSSNGG